MTLAWDPKQPFIIQTCERNPAKVAKGIIEHVCIGEDKDCTKQLICYYAAQTKLAKQFFANNICKNISTNGRPEFDDVGADFNSFQVLLAQKGKKDTVGEVHTDITMVRTLCIFF